MLRNVPTRPGPCLCELDEERTSEGGRECTHAMEAGEPMLYTCSETVSEVGQVPGLGLIWWRLQIVTTVETSRVLGDEAALQCAKSMRSRELR